MNFNEENMDSLIDMNLQNNSHQSHQGVPQRWQKIGIGFEFLHLSQIQIKADSVINPVTSNKALGATMHAADKQLFQSEQQVNDEYFKVRYHNQVLLKNMIKQPLITQPDPLKTLQNQYVVDYISDQIQLEAKMQEQHNQVEDHIHYYKESSSFFSPSTYYYDQLTIQEQKVYQQIDALIAKNQQFLINTDYEISGSKIAHAYNLDHIFNFKGKAVFKTGQLKFKSYGAEEQFGYYLKNREQSFIEEQILNLVEQYTNFIDSFQCVNQLLEHLAAEIKLTNDWRDATIFHCLVAKKCNSIALARTLVVLFRKFQINCFVIGGLFLKNEHYWNIMEYDVQKETVYTPMGAIANNINKEPFVYSCIDLYASILNKIEAYVPTYHINIDMDRMNVDHNVIKYFSYPKTACFIPIEHKIQSHQQLREVLKKASFILNRLDDAIQKEYYDILVDFGDDYNDTLEYMKQSKVDIQSIILRYAPNFIFKDLVLPRSNTPTITLAFQRQQIQDFLLYPEIVSEFDNTKQDHIVHYILQHIQNMQKLVIPLNTDIDLAIISKKFSEDYMHHQLQLYLFNVSNTYDSCIYRYTISAHCVVIIFIQIPVYNQVPKFTRKNRFLLFRNELYVYSMIVQSLMKRFDECQIPYMEQISEHKLIHIIQCIRLDYPELYFIPTAGIASQYDSEKRELKIIFPLPDFTKIQKQDYQINQAITQLQLRTKLEGITEIDKEEQILQRLIDNYYPKVQLDKTAVNAYDFLISYKISSMSIAAAFGLLCQTVQLATCVIKSEKSNRCVNLVFIKEHVTISDVFIQYQDKIQLTKTFNYYPTFSININCNIFNFLDTSFNSIQTQIATKTFNQLYSRYYIDSVQEEAVDKLKQIFWEQFMQKFYNIQFCYKRLKKESIEQFISKNMGRVTSFMLMQHSPIHPCKYRVFYSKHLPVVLIQLFKEMNRDEFEEKIENLEASTQQYLLPKIRQTVSQNKLFAYIRLSSRTLPNLYESQFEKYKFASFFQNQLQKEISLRRARLNVILKAHEYCLIFEVEKVSEFLPIVQQSTQQIQDINTQLDRSNNLKTMDLANYTTFFKQLQ